MLEAPAEDGQRSPGVPASDERLQAPAPFGHAHRGIPRCRQSTQQIRREKRMVASHDDDSLVSRSRNGGDKAREGTAHRMRLGDELEAGQGMALPALAHDENAIRHGREGSSDALRQRDAVDFDEGLVPPQSIGCPADENRGEEVRSPGPGHRRQGFTVSTGHGAPRRTPSAVLP